MHHTGIVREVNDTKVYTIEGNTSNGWWYADTKISYYKSSWQIINSQDGVQTVGEFTDSQS